MPLVDLPLELVEQVIGEVIVDLRPEEFMHLRLVSKLFDVIIVNTIISVPSIRDDLEKFLSHSPWFNKWMQRKFDKDSEQELQFNAIVHESVKRYLLLNPLAGCDRPLLLANLLDLVQRPADFVREYFRTERPKRTAFWENHISPAEEDILNGAFVLAVSLDDVSSMDQLVKEDTAIYQRCALFKPAVVVAARHAAYNALLSMPQTALLSESRDPRDNCDAYSIALYEAAYHGRNHIVKLLLNAHDGDKLKARSPRDGDRGDSSFLYWTIHGQNYDLMYWILNTGSTCHVSELRSSINLAVDLGIQKIVQDLVETSPYPPSKMGLEYALEEAVRENHIEIARYLLQQDIEGHRRGGFGSSLFCAIDTSNLETVNLLLDAGADINKDCHGNNRARRPYYLIQRAFQMYRYGCDLEHKDRVSCEDLVMYLIRRGADPTLLADDNLEAFAELLKKRGTSMESVRRHLAGEIETTEEDEE